MLPGTTFYRELNTLGSRDFSERASSFHFPFLSYNFLFLFSSFPFFAQRESGERPYSEEDGGKRAREIAKKGIRMGPKLPQRRKGEGINDGRTAYNRRKAEGFISLFCFCFGQSRTAVQDKRHSFDLSLSHTRSVLQSLLIREMASYFFLPSAWLDRLNRIIDFGYKSRLYLRRMPPNQGRPMQLL